MFEKEKRTQTFHGILFVALFACSAFYISETPLMRYISFSPLIVGIILGMAYANTLKKDMPQEWIPGITFCSKKILRAAIVLYGFRLTFQHIAQVGLMAIVADLVIICGTILLGMLLAKLLKIDRGIALLTATGSAICGAAAVLATEPILNHKPYKTAIAVSTVVIFGTIAMFVYPLMYRSGLFELTPQQWGVYTGSTVHEVAHVVGSGNAMGEEIGATAIIVKMIRVMFLAPLLLVYAVILSRCRAGRQGASATPMKITVPWFAFGFIVVIGFNSLGLLPESVVGGIEYIDTFMLTMAMTALGMETDFKRFKEAGVKPFILALFLFIWLILGGYFLVKWLPF